MMDGKQADQFRSETIMPEGTLMLCDGTCLVQMQNIQVVARDKAVFAMAETPERWNITIKSGQVDFAMGPKAKLIDFGALASCVPLMMHKAGSQAPGPG